ncbi:uncharacterized protein [Elaeis guineensis]|uniref:Uncharacterized protein LOC105052977 n=1 Tax=Elaeis guineensis var. tenera TaxID=51953 RepID=A0A6I9RTE7_ELAGV|nr:uncharacterized protein LOC105052977 [Elaeis guineensis]XP_010932279.1 uncharacterized protein LOC105052977 [Elaeis guineensis]XP_010932287.1 uncharacterized protein LOC105052977 [Elaeis guineensis]XP_010932295.1 uncharacterized protein LOC105052977 [Elaeis guineensis]
MDLQLEQLESVTLADVLRESVSIPRSSPRTFALITLTLVFPLSFAVLAHTLFTHPIFRHLHASSSSSSGEWALLLLYQFIYLLFLFTFSLLSTAAVVFAVASLYAAKPVSFRSTLSAIRPILPRLLRTFLWVALIMLLYNLAFAFSILLLLVATHSVDSPSFLLGLALVLLAFLAAHVYISAIWHLASVVSVLEPICGLAAMTKSRDLLRGRARMAAAFVATYLGFCGLIGWAFRAIVVKGPDEDGSAGAGTGTKVLIGGALVAVLVVLNLVGLLVQSVFYYVCKSYHHQQIDKSVLYDHLGGYLGEYVPLKSSIQMENF